MYPVKILGGHVPPPQTEASKMEGGHVPLCLHGPPMLLTSNFNRLSLLSISFDLKIVQNVQDQSSCCPTLSMIRLNPMCDI